MHSTPEERCSSSGPPRWPPRTASHAALFGPAAPRLAAALAAAGLASVTRPRDARRSRRRRARPRRARPHDRLRPVVPDDDRRSALSRSRACSGIPSRATRRIEFRHDLHAKPAFAERGVAGAMLRRQREPALWSSPIGTREAPVLIDCDVHISPGTALDIVDYTDSATRELLLHSGHDGFALPGLSLVPPDRLGAQGRVRPAERRPEPAHDRPRQGARAGARRARRHVRHRDARPHRRRALRPAQPAARREARERAQRLDARDATSSRSRGCAG